MSDTIALFIIIPIVLIYTLLHFFEIIRGIYKCVNKNRDFQENVQRETQVSEVLVSEPQHLGRTPGSTENDLVNLSSQQESRQATNNPQFCSSVFTPKTTISASHKSSHDRSDAENVKNENKA